MGSFLISTLKIPDDSAQSNEPEHHDRTQSVESEIRGGAETLASYPTPPLSPAADLLSGFGSALGVSKRCQQRGMEGGDPHRRHYEHSDYPPGFVPNIRNQSVAGASGSDIYGVQNPRSTQRTGASDRFRQTQSLNQPTPTSMGISSSGGHPQALSSYGYGPGQQYTAHQMQGNTLQYQPDYMQDPQRQQQLSGYTTQMMHGVPQHVQPQSPYDNMPQYQPRQPAAIDLLSSQFGGSQYYNPGESTSASVPASMPQQYATANYQHQLPYQSSSISRSALPATYASEMTGFPQAEPPVADDQPTQSWEHEYEQRLREINEHISNGTLGEAAPMLLELSQWFLGRVNEFGLTVDVVAENTDVHDARVNMWTEFNFCWLALLQRQKENTEQIIHLDQAPTPSDSLLNVETLERMGTELVRLCDGIERHGLVDYEMGVAEEEIISILTECLDLLPNDEVTTESDAAAGPAQT